MDVTTEHGMPIDVTDDYSCIFSTDGYRFYGPGVTPSGTHAVGAKLAVEILQMIQRAFDAGREDKAKEIQKALCIIE